MADGRVAILPFLILFFSSNPYQFPVCLPAHDSPAQSNSTPYAISVNVFLRQCSNFQAPAWRRNWILPRMAQRGQPQPKMDLPQKIAKIAKKENVSPCLCVLYVPSRQKYCWNSMISRYRTARCSHEDSSRNCRRSSRHAGSLPLPALHPKPDCETRNVTMLRTPFRPALPLKTEG